jgi:polyisoprenoid-binding protein YceI
MRISLLVLPLALAACATAGPNSAVPGVGAASAPAVAADPAKAANLAAQPAGVYEVEPTHTTVVWRLSHSGLSTYTARFDRVSGTITLDPANPINSSADILIDVASVSTGLPDFDKKLASDVLKAGTTPQMRFKSTSLVATSPTTGRLTGDLTMAGVTKPVTLDVSYNTGRMSPFAKRQNIGFSASGTIKRSDWGVDSYIAFGIGDQVDLVIEAEFLKKE